MGSTAKGIVYPNPGDQPRRLAFETLATTADTAIGNEVSAAVSLLGLWSNFSPEWTATTTNPTLGNGTLTGRFVQIGKTVHFSMILALGSTTTIGSGNYRFSLPVACADTTYSPIGSSHLRDSSGPDFRLYPAFLVTSTTVGVMNGATAAQLTNVAPWTWAVGDQIRINGTYEAA